MLNQGRFYLPQSLTAPQCQKPWVLKDQEAPIIKKNEHVPAARSSGKGKIMIPIAISYMVCVTSNITYSVPEYLMMRKTITKWTIKLNYLFVGNVNKPVALLTKTCSKYIAIE